MNEYHDCRRVLRAWALARSSGALRSYPGNERVSRPREDGEQGKPRRVWPLQSRLTGPPSNLGRGLHTASTDATRWSAPVVDPTAIDGDRPRPTATDGDRRRSTTANSGQQRPTALDRPFGRVRPRPPGRRSGRGAGPGGERDRERGREGQGIVPCRRTIDRRRLITVFHAANNSTSTQSSGTLTQGARTGHSIRPEMDTGDGWRNSALTRRTKGYRPARGRSRDPRGGDCAPSR